MLHLANRDDNLATEAVTWKQVSSAEGKVSNVLLFICVSSKLNLPPNSCIPSRAKMMRNRKSSSNREQMAFIEFSREVTRSERAVQCLGEEEKLQRNTAY